MAEKRRPDVWLVDVTAEPYQALADSDLPTEEDRARAGALADPDAGRRLLARRAALRVILSRYVGIEPSLLRIVRAPGGKPVLVPPRNGSEGTRPTFSVAHTGGLLAVAVGTSSSLGVDVELLRTVSRARAIADRWFGPDEAARLDDVAADEVEAEFMRLWTAKARKGLESILPMRLPDGSQWTQRRKRLSNPC